MCTIQSPLPLTAGSGLKEDSGDQPCYFSFHNKFALYERLFAIHIITTLVSIVEILRLHQMLTRTQNGVLQEHLMTL